MSGRDKAGKRLRQFREQRLAHGHRQIIPGEQAFADRRQMTEAIDDPLQGEGCDIRVRIEE